MSTKWREARSLQTLERELQEFYPGTTTWEIGDDDHQDSWSDHNPNDANVVCAKDILADGGISLQRLADHLVSNPHPNLRYVIYNRRIAQRKNGFEWQEYHGKNAHKTHLHASVGNGPDGRSTKGYDNTSSWGIAKLAGKPSTPPRPGKPDTGTTDWTENIIMALPMLKEKARGTDVKRLQGLLQANGYTDSRIDGRFGPQTERALKRFQKNRKVKNSVVNGNGDGICGEHSWRRLLGE